MASESLSLKELQREVSHYRRLLSTKDKIVAAQKTSIDRLTKENKALSEQLATAKQSKLASVPSDVHTLQLEIHSLKQENEVLQGTVDALREGRDEPQDIEDRLRAERKRWDVEANIAMKSLELKCAKQQEMIAALREHAKTQQPSAFPRPQDHDREDPLGVRHAEDMLVPVDEQGPQASPPDDDSALAELVYVQGREIHQPTSAAAPVHPKQYQLALMSLRGELKALYRLYRQARMDAVMLKAAVSEMDFTAADIQGALEEHDADKHQLETKLEQFRRFFQRI